MGILTMLSTPLCLLFFYLCLKTAFSSSLHASSFSTTHLCSHEEALALLQFKTSFSINYPVYLCDTKANYSKTDSWKEGIDCCSWDGVSCDNVTGHVIALDLSCGLLSGTFPSNSTLFLLKNLQSLNLAFNDFRLSKIPPKISQFTRLKHLDISSSRFSGQVPAEIAHLPKLVSLNLSTDSDSLILETTTLRNLVQNLSEVRELVLSGVIMTSVNPRFFMNLSSSLTTLNLSKSELRGSFPNSIFLFPNLKTFTLSGNENLTIDLPSSNWSSPLQNLYLDVMDCGRQLPESIGDLKSLQSLSLGCNLEGSIPASIGNLSQLTHLGLYSNNFNGQIPTSLANLRQLHSLELSDDQFFGPIPAFIGNLSQLILLSLSSNNLNGQIPSSLAKLTQLRYLHLSNNQFSGPIPASTGNLSLLTVLDLSSNNLSGQIPSSLANLAQLALIILDLSHNNLGGKIPNGLPMFLSVLNLQGNNFDGNIPFGFSGSCGLQNLNLHGNQMEGLLPRSLVNCSMLEVLDVGNNNIEDTFPNWLESLPNLQVLVLRSNKFHGSVQSIKESATFPKLRVLDLSNNDFLGPLPVRYIENFNAMMDTHRDDGSPEYMQTRSTPYQYSLVVTMKGFDYELQRILTVFSSIHLSNNNFGGEIPDVIGKLSSLKGLNLSHNNLTGPISPSLGNLTNLEWLDLSSNELVGQIPGELLSLTQLTVLNLSNNHLVGPIPQGHQFSTFGNDSYEGNPELCGFPLSKACAHIVKPSSSSHEKDKLWRFVWRVVVLGYGCGVAFGQLM